MAEIVMRVRKSELGDKCENGGEDREPKYIHYFVRSAGRLMSTRVQERGPVASEAKNSMPVFATLLTSFNIRFTIFVHTSLHMADRPKSTAMPTNGNVHARVLGLRWRVNNFTLRYVIYKVSLH